jgi:uncharacterized membrane protein
MALSDWYSNILFLLRWIHVFFAIIWIGHLYFFNFVNVPLQGALDDATKKLVNPKLMPRALWWFRWGAMVTFVSGWILFTTQYMYSPDGGFGPTPLFSTPDGISARAIWVLFGMILGSIMWFNVWFIIWPAQKSMLQGKVTAENLPAVRKKALLTSRVNTFLSAPLLFAMLAPQSYGAINPVTLIVVCVIGAATIWHLIKFSPKVGTGI